MFLDIDYEVLVTDQSPRTTSMRLCDGSKVLVKANFNFAEYDPIEIPWPKLRQTIREVPADLDEKDLTKGTIAKGEYLPDQAATAELLARFAIDEQRFGRVQLACLLWSSYLVGMEQPGLRALFNKLTLSFENLQGCCNAQFSYEAEVISFTSISGLRSSLRLFSRDQLVGSGESCAFLTPRRPIGSVSAVTNLLPPSSQLKDKVALVIGASRGLGAMLTTVLAFQGCTVLANFNRSQSEAHQLQGTLADAPGSVTLVKGNAADLAWCEQLMARVSDEFGRLDFLICNACPPILPLQLEPKMVERINSYVSNALALVTVPLSVFLGLVEKTSGWSVVISSASVETTPKEWPHYVAVKSAIEGLTRVAALQYPNASFLLVRPTRLHTDLTNSPFRQVRAMPPEIAATKIVRRLQHAARDHLEVLYL